MKKNVLYYALMASMLVSCSKGGDEKEGDDGRVPIVMGMGIPPEVNVRGAGAVGSIDGKWNGQSLRIMAFRKGKISNEAADIVGIGSTGIMATTNTNEMTSGLTWAGGINTLYYPIQYAYDFYGYYIDDISDNAVITPDTEGTPGKVSVPVTIDGTQDLMVAKAELTDAQKAQLEAAANLVPDATEEEKNAEYAKAYSSYAARRGVQPSMVFKHLLSRFTFEVKAGEPELVSNDLDGVYITKVELTDFSDTDEAKPSFDDKKSRGVENKGTLQVAVAEQKLDITPIDPLNPVFLSLSIKETVTVGGTTFNGVKPNSDVTFVSIGESLMFMSGHKHIRAAITMKQVKDGKIIEVEGKNEFTFYSTITSPATTGKFTEGYSYRVNLTMFGLKPVIIDAVLTPWKNGGSIDIVPGD